MGLDIKLTQGAYWKGSQIPYWLYMTITVLPFTGLLGFDHLLLRSPWTFILKLISIIPLFGFWYFYDIAQAFGEKELIEKHGIGVPFYGPIGIGAGIFTGEGVPMAPPDVAKPWTFMFYVISTLFFVVTPINKLVIGDYSGALAQIIMYIVFPLTFMALFWGFYDMYRIFFNQKALFEEGASRMPPASFILGANFDKGALGPFPSEDLSKSQDQNGYSTKGITGFINSLFAIPIAVLGIGKTAIQGVGGIVAKEIPAAASGVIHSVEGSVKGVTDSVDLVVKDTVEPTVKAVGSVTKAVEGISGFADKLAEINPDAIADKIAEKAVKSQTPTLQTPALPPPAVGGAIIGGALISKSEPSVSTSVLLFSVALIAFSGYVMYTFRKTYYKTTEHNDTPPDPSPVRGTSKTGTKH
jgi:hypothetical protein